MPAIAAGCHVRWSALTLVAATTISCDSPRPVQPSVIGSNTAGHAAIEAASDVALVVGNFIVAQPGNAILRYDGTGRFVDRFVPLTVPGGPRGGCCMTFGPDEHLYVSAGGMSTVNRFNGVTGEYLGQFVPSGSGGLVQPLVIVFGPDGNLYVGDIGTRSIRRYDGATGAFIDHFIPPGSLGGPGSGDPQLFVFGPDGNLYVASPGLNRVRRFSGIDGAFMDDFVMGTTDARVIAGVLFGPDGNFYVGMGNGVNRYDGTTGQLIDHFVPQGSGGLSVPVGFVFGPDGNFYVASPGSSGDGSILRYDGITGEFIDAFVPASEPNITGPRVLEFKSKIVMCHRPPGKPGNERSISIGYLYAAEHVAHGDAVGSCVVEHQAVEAVRYSEWSAPVNLGPIVNSPAVDIEVSVARDGLSLYLASARNGGQDIWVATRSSIEAPWGAPEALGPPVNTASRDQGPFLSVDGHRLYLFSDRGGGLGGTDLYVSRRRDQRNEFAWEAAVNLGPGVNSVSNENLATLFEDTLYFNSNRPGLGGTDIYASAPLADGSYGAAVLVPELSSPLQDAGVAIRRDGLELIMSSTRPGGAGGFDLWSSTRASSADRWSTPVNLGAVVNSSSDESRLALSFDGTELYIISDRPGGAGGLDLWMSSRSKLRGAD